MLTQGLITTLGLSLLTGASPILQNRFKNKSSKSIIQEFDKYRRANDKLFFIGKRSFSADFYSQGKAEFIPDLRTLEQRLENDQGFIVTKNKIENTGLNALEEKISLVSSRGNYTLYKTNQP